MNVLWLLLALSLAVVVYAAWEILRFFGRTARAHRMPSVAAAHQRTIRWISTEELAAVLAHSDEIVVVDLQSDLRPGRPLPVPVAHVLPVRPGELTEILEWLPANRSAVFCGVSGLSTLLIQTSSCMNGNAPLYFLSEDRSPAEAA